MRMAHRSPAASSAALTPSAAGVGVVILAYGAEGLHLPLLESLPASGVDPASITVVHNPAARGETLPPPGPGRFRVIEMARNEGYAGGMNAGIRQQLADGVANVLLLTHDVRFLPGGLERLLAAARSAPEPGILGPALSWRGQPFAYGGVVDSNGYASLRTELGPKMGQKMGQKMGPKMGPVAAADWVEGSALLVPAAVFKGVGLLDDRFFMYFEEVEFCLRAVRAGWRVGIVVDAVAEQEPGFDRRPATYSYLMTRNGLEYARRAAGGRGLVHGLGRAVAAAVGHLKAWKGRRSLPDQRRRGRARLLATLLGVAAFLARRWGPPPGFLQALDAA